MNNHEPIFKSIFGSDWDYLPPVLKKHYANSPFCNDTNICNGHLSIRSAFILRIFGPLLKLMGSVPAVNAENVPVTVNFKSDPNSTVFHFIRTFNFDNRPAYIFHSKMLQIKGNDVVEVMKYRLCWRIKFFLQNEKVILAHNGFALYLFGKFIPLPITWILGKIHAEEKATSDTSFQMFVEIRHWLFGKIFEYRGDFEMVIVK